MIGVFNFLLEDFRITTVELEAALEVSRSENNPLGLESNVVMGVAGMDSSLDKSSSKPLKVGNLPRVEAGTGVAIASNGSDLVPDPLGSV